MTSFLTERGNKWGHEAFKSGSIVKKQNRLSEVGIHCVCSASADESG